MKTICFMGESIMDINEELDVFKTTHKVISVIYRFLPECCVAEVKYY